MNVCIHSRGIICVSLVGSVVMFLAGDLKVPGSNPSDDSRYIFVDEVK